MGRKPLDLTGFRFGRLVAVKNTFETKGSYVWLCRCECGNEVKVTVPNLRSGNSKSCGCLKSDIVSEVNSKSEVPKSGVRGITYHQPSENWVVRNGREYVGCNKDLQEAIKMKEKWSEEND